MNKNGDGRNFSLTFGVGRNGKEATLDLESSLYMLREINISEDIVKEIIVSYWNGSKESVSKARLKNATIHVSYEFPKSDKNIGTEYLLNNLDHIFEVKGKECVEQREKIMKEKKASDITDFDLIFEEPQEKMQ